MTFWKIAYEHWQKTCISACVAIHGILIINGWLFEIFSPYPPSQIPHLPVLPALYCVRPASAPPRASHLPAFPLAQPQVGTVDGRLHKTGMSLCELCQGANIFCTSANNDESLMHAYIKVLFQWQKWKSALRGSLPLKPRKHFVSTWALEVYFEIRFFNFQYNR